MNHTLRARHRAMTLGMALAAGGGLAAGLLSRPEPPVMADLPQALQTQLPAPGAPLHSGARWTGASIESTVYAEQVSLTVLEPLRVPAPLVYWSPTQPALDDAGVPDGARLLGTLSGDPGQRLPLPDSRAGALLVFSLGRGQVVATLSLEALP